MKFTFLSVVAAAASYCSAFDTSDFGGSSEPTTWYFLRYTIPTESSFTSLTGQLTVPPLKHANGGTYYLWPGLQVANWAGIYQNVLSGNDSGTWTYWSGYCCDNPEFTWSDSMNAYEGDTITFSNVKSDTTWTTTSTEVNQGTEVTSGFDALSVMDFESAVFAIELIGTAWDFGPLEFANIVITATGQDASWCNDKPSNWQEAADYYVSDVTSRVDETGVTCQIGSIILNGPRGIQNRSAAKGSGGSSGSNRGSENATSTTTAATPSATGNAGSGALLEWKTWTSLMVLLFVMLHL